ncbi:uncharacterized protein BKA55DRAFT_536009 [Fusarium redolens]|jgi:hypothetical protein|uniref:Uncharacterized protein n=1 Tax=Fusarium redolens TaxID=48865 RepID=A0A9P9HND8_FUSRE|nr:uncharacterized protein BKA55DRAFT_536009 [Fusarium redolens]KAH7261003.1 hypothetical protein BKA55DRAFT_536009 [Fusarium redolens]
MSYARCVVTPDPTIPSTLGLQFSHTKYAKLCAMFLNKKIRGTDSCNFVYDQIKAINMSFTISWTNEGDDFLFENGQGAVFWERVIGLCITILPLRMRITKELEWTTFKERLEISDEEWSEAWDVAVLDMPENTPLDDDITTVVQEGAKIMRSITRLGSRFSKRFRFPRFSKNEKKGQDGEVAKETTAAAWIS